MSSGNQLKDAGRATTGMIDAAGWGVFFIWVGVALMADVGWGLALFGVGVIWLVAQVARTLFGLKVDRWGAAIGACLVVAGLVVWLDIPLDTASLAPWLIPAMFIVFGVAILASVWMRRRKGGGGR